MPEERPADERPTDQAAEPLRVVLHSLEEQVDLRVDKVAESKPTREESTSELIKLEEALDSAQDKAKQLVTLRLKLGDRPAEAGEEGDAAGRVAGEAGAPAGGDAGSDASDVGDADGEHPAAQDESSEPEGGVRQHGDQEGSG
jgi:hypothetical protein